jgi:hypothetical protein
MKLVNIQINCLILCIIGFCLLNPSASTDNPQYQNFDEYYALSIRSISDGFGLDIELLNEGSEDISDITIEYGSSGGIFMFPSDRVISIGDLPAGKSRSVHLGIFGIGFGQITTFPLISLSISASSIHSIERDITATVFGPLVRVVGINFDDNASFNGYTVFSPEYGTETYLINNQGDIVHQWNSAYIQGFGVHILENSDLIRTGIPGVNPTFSAGGITGLVEVYDWNGSQKWEFRYSDADHCSHHAIEVLPNGNVLLIAWEYKSTAETIQAGRDPKTIPAGSLWPDHIIEVKQTGATTGIIVWEWHVWDHLIQDFDPSKENYGVIADHPELIDINYLPYGKLSPDLNHINSIDYHEGFDQILLSAHNQNEIWVIDHSTTAEEAAGHIGGRYGNGGDLLYRWGNPLVYQAGIQADQRLFGQHDAQWISDGHPGEGHILIFNNGQGRPDGRYSSIDELITPVDGSGNYSLSPGGAYGPEDLFWRYTAAEEPSVFFAGHISGCQRLPNGNTLICEGPNGFFFEVSMDKKIVWQYLNLYPSILNNHVADIERYAPEYSGLRFLK